MTTAVAANGTPSTSWWYGQGRAEDMTRRLETVAAMVHAPAPAGVISVAEQLATVTFVAAHGSPLPPPWQPAGKNEARIEWADVPPGVPPDPTHPVYLVVLGVAPDGALVALNLAAFARIRLSGEPDMVTALVKRWILELVSTHPDTTIAVSGDVWDGPHTRRIKPVAAGSVPTADVLILGGQVSYADRTQIVAASTSAIVVDLGADAATPTTWVLTCDGDQMGSLANIARPGAAALTAALILPTAQVLDTCGQWVAGTDAAAPAQPPVPEPAAISEQPAFPEQTAAPAASGVDFFVPQADTGQSGWDHDDDDWPRPPAPTLPGPAVPSTPEPDSAPPNSAHPDNAEPAVSPEPDLAAAPVAATGAPGEQTRGDQSGDTLDPPLPQPERPPVAVIWNRILGQVELTPPHGGPAVKDREQRCNELLVYMQSRHGASATDLAKDIYGGGASDKTLQQQMSVLRTRLGVVHTGGAKALPPQSEGRYRPDPIVRSDWQEFDRLVNLLVDSTPTGALIAALDLVTGRPFSGIGANKDWVWAASLRDEITDRVAQASVVLANRHYAAHNYPAAVEVARKGLWYNTARQDLWEIALLASSDGRDTDTFRVLREQYLHEIPVEERDSEVFELTRRT